jgi:multicomponent Na+:H+ antiporter subunit G
MNVLNMLSIILCIVGAVFYLAGTVGLLRFPDAYSRLHALTKADNLGLGFIVLGLSFQATSAAVVVKLLLIWLLTMFAGANACYLIGRHMLRTSRESDR